jgi:hypothetical protein
MPCLPLIGETACPKQIGCHSFPSAADQHVRAFMVSAGSVLRVTPARGIDDNAAYDSPSIIKAAIATAVPLIGRGCGVLALNANAHYLALFRAFAEVCCKRASQR